MTHPKTAKPIGSGKAGFDGSYSFIIGKQLTGSIISITVTDAAGNSSTAAEVTVVDEKVTKVTVTTAKPVHRYLEKPFSLQPPQKAAELLNIVSILSIKREIQSTHRLMRKAKH